MGFSRQEYWSGLPFPSPEDEAQAGIKIAGKNINNLRYADEPTLMAEMDEQKRFLMKVKEESEKVALKLNIQKTKITASGPTTSWQIVGGNNGNSKRLHFGGYKITADGDCSHEIKRHLLLGRKVITNLANILKSRHITLPTKVHLVKALVFPVVMYYMAIIITVLWWTNSHVWMWELDYKKKLSVEELMFLNCGVGEDSWEYLGLQGDQTSPS